LGPSLSLKVLAKNQPTISQQSAKNQPTIS